MAHVAVEISLVSFIMGWAFRFLDAVTYNFFPSPTIEDGCVFLFSVAMYIIFNSFVKDGKYCQFNLPEWTSAINYEKFKEDLSGRSEFVVIPRQESQPEEVPLIGDSNTADQSYIDFVFIRNIYKQKPATRPKTVQSDDGENIVVAEKLPENAPHHKYEFHTENDNKFLKG